MKKGKEDALFAVSLDGVNLTDAQLKRIDSGIKDVVMRELASIDNDGDLAITSKLASNPRLKDFLKIPGGHTAGIWVRKILING